MVIVGRTNRLRMDREGVNFLRGMSHDLFDYLDPACDKVSIVFPYQGRWVEGHARRTGPDRFRATIHDGPVGYDSPVVYDRDHTLAEIFAAYGTAYRRIIARIRELDPAALAVPVVAAWRAEVAAILARGE